MKARNFLKNGSLVLLSFLFSIGVSEIIVRTFYPQISEHDNLFQFDSDLGWTFIPNKKSNIIFPGEANHSIKTNKDGFRDSSFLNFEKESAKIFVLGDSFVSNISVKNEDVFTEILEQNLTNTSVLNLGVNGYGTVQEKLLLEKWLPKINPNLIVFVIYLRNDFADNLKETNWLYPRPTVAWKEETKTLEVLPFSISNFNNGNKNNSYWKFYKNLHLYHFIKNRSRNIKSNFLQKDTLSANSYTPPESYLCRKVLSEETKLMYLTMEKLLVNISKTAQNKQIPLVFVLAPSIVQVENNLWEAIAPPFSKKQEEYSRTLPNDTLMQFAKNNGLNMIDLLPMLQAETEKGKILYNPNEQHWTKEGNRLVANYLLSYITDKKFLHKID